MAERLSYPNKDSNSTNATERIFHDFEANEIKHVTDDHAGRIEDLELTSPPSANPYYGRWPSLLSLATAHPVGILNGWAIIDAGAGVTPQVAAWDEIDVQWELSGYEDYVIYVNTFSALPGAGENLRIYVTTNNYQQYVWHNSGYHLLNSQQTYPINRFRVNQISETPPDTTTATQLLIKKNGVDRIIGFIFDYNYSQYLRADKLQFDDGVNMVIKLYNKTKLKQFIATIQGFAFTDGTEGYMLISVNATLLASDFSVSDDVEILINYTVAGSGGTNLFLGTYTSLVNLTAAHPSPVEGSVANIDEGVTKPVRQALWDNDDDEWVLGAEVVGMVGEISAAASQPTPLDASIWGYINAGGILVRTTWADFKATLKTYFDTIYVSTANFKEEKIKGTKIKANVGSSYAIDINVASDFHLTMTAATTFTISNKPTGNEVRRFKVRLKGEFAATLPLFIEVYGDDYDDGTKWYDFIFELWYDSGDKGIVIIQERA